MTDSWTDDGETVALGPVQVGEPMPLPPVEPVNVHSPAVRRDIERREALRAEELTHLTDLRDRVQQGINNGAIDLESGAALLLNISKARMALSGVGMYPF